MSPHQKVAERYFFYSIGWFTLLFISAPEFFRVFVTWVLAFGRMQTYYWNVGYGPLHLFLIAFIVVMWVLSIAVSCANLRGRTNA